MLFVPGEANYWLNSIHQLSKKENKLLWNESTAEKYPEIVDDFQHSKNDLENTNSIIWISSYGWV